jgi:hypothetical protein
MVYLGLDDIVIAPHMRPEEYATTKHDEALMSHAGKRGISYIVKYYH